MKWIGLLPLLLLAVIIVVHSASSATSCVYRANGALPDPFCTPGSINHAVTQRTIKATICKTGWTTSIRPPKSVTEPQKFASMRAYGDPTAVGEAAKYEFDHLIPLELGGAPDDKSNMWPEPHSLHDVNGRDEGSFAKDRIENELNRLVCTGAITLAKARRVIRTNWLNVP